MDAVVKIPSSVRGHIDGGGGGNVLEGDWICRGKKEKKQGRSVELLLYLLLCGIQCHRSILIPSSLIVQAVRKSQGET